MSRMAQIVELRGARNGAVSDSAKLRGGYYTPERVAKFLARWAIHDRDAQVLEPSCGDGEVVAAAAMRLGKKGHVTGIEVFEEEAAKAALRGGSSTSTTVADAFRWFRESERAGTFDVCLGNPPFIRYQTFPEEHRDQAFALMREEGLHPTRLTNAWLPFVVLGTKALRPGGRLALVLPAELLQVGYAAELREYLVRKFSHVTVVTFRKLVFPDIQQETILLLGVRSDEGVADISFVELDSVEDLKLEMTLTGERVEADLDHGREKWTQYYLSAKELGLVRELEASDVFTTLGDLAEVDVGVVTGRNEFFVLTPEQAESLGLQEACLPLVGRSVQIPGLVLTAEDWQKLASENKRCLLLQLGDVARSDLSRSARAYVRWGERNDVHEGYKCRIRKPHWWRVPSVWTPDAFLLRQIYDGPRIVENRAEAISTDTIHRVRTKPGVSASGLAAVSMNSVTFAFSEIRGRSYGGGVLELEPSEAEALPFPKAGDDLSTDELDAHVRKHGVESALNEVDRHVLMPIGLSETDIQTMRSIWRKLYERRLARKRR